MASMRFLALVAVVVVIATCTESRYLPTRADDSKMEEIRGILTELLDKVSSVGGTRSAGVYEKRFIYPRSSFPVYGDAMSDEIPSMHAPHYNYASTKP